MKKAFVKLMLGMLVLLAVYKGPVLANSQYYAQVTCFTTCRAYAGLEGWCDPLFSPNYGQANYWTYTCYYDNNHNFLSRSFPTCQFADNTYCCNNLDNMHCTHADDPAYSACTCNPTDP